MSLFESSKMITEEENLARDKLRSTVENWADSGLRVDIGRFMPFRRSTSDYGTEEPSLTKPAIPGLRELPLG